MEELIKQQNELLAQIVKALGKSNDEVLGFCEAPKADFIYVNRTQPGVCWYRLVGKDRQVVPINQSGLKCVVEKLEFKQVERRGKETWKTHLHVRADGRYILESGYDSNFSKSIISVLAVTPPEILRNPVTIEVQPADSDEVVFGRVYSSTGDLLFAPYDDSTDWKTAAKRAKENVDALSADEF